MTRKHIEWLKKELPGWQADGLIDSEQAFNIENRYSSELSKPQTPWAVRAFAILGALLLGAGVLLLFAYNWNQLSRPIRAVASYLPLLMALGIAPFFILSEKRRQGPGVEGVALFWSLAVGASISLIAQTYHLPGSASAFCMSWALLLIPVLYLTHSLSVFILYQGLALFWAGYQQTWSGHSLGWWVLFAASVPILAEAVRDPKNTPRRACFLWATLISLFIAFGIVLEKCLPGLWIMVYAAFIGVLALADGAGESKPEGFWLRPAESMALLGNIVFSLILSWTWPWKSIGWRYYRIDSGYYEWVGGADVVLLLVLFSVWALRLMRTRPRELWRMATAVAPVFALLAYITLSVKPMDWVPVLLYNGYLFVLGLALLAEGIRDRKLGRLNLGMLVLCVLVVFRFFDGEFSILGRAVVFMILGAGFLTANVILGRRLRRAS